MKLFFLFLVSCLLNFVSGNETGKSSTIKPEKVYNLVFSVIESISKEKDIKGIMPYPIFVNMENMNVIFKTKNNSFTLQWKHGKWNLNKNDKLDFMFSMKGDVSFNDIKKSADNYILNKVNIFNKKKIHSIEFNSKVKMVLFVADENMKFGELIGGGDIYNCEYINKEWNVVWEAEFDM